MIDKQALRELIQLWVDSVIQCVPINGLENNIEHNSCDINLGCVYDGWRALPNIFFTWKRNADRSHAFRLNGS